MTKDFVISERNFLKGLLQRSADRICHHDFVGEESDGEKTNRAYDFVVAFGQSLRYGIPISNRINQMLTPAIVLAATPNILQLISEIKSDVLSLERWLEEEDELFLRQSMCADVIGCVELVEATISTIEHLFTNNLDYQNQLSNESGKLEETLNKLQKPVSELSDLMMQNSRTLSLAATNATLENLRELCSEKVQDMLPWWLNGTLETLAQCRMKFEASLRKCHPN